MRDGSSGGTFALTGSRLLGLLPLGVALVLGAVSLPVATEPEAIPLPRADARSLARAADEDRTLAARAKEGLPGDARVLGTALRDLHMMQASPVAIDMSRVTEARRKLDSAAISVSKLPDGKDVVRRLRAYQLEAFLAEVRAFEAGAEASDELKALAGGFIERMTAVGWVVGHHVLFDEAALRTAYKITWNGTVGVERNPDLAPALDEQRALYTFYLRHPHIPEDEVGILGTLKASHKDEAGCRMTQARAEHALEGWRLDKVKKLGEIDPEYPTDYAVGVLLYRRQQYADSRDAFRKWIERHPGGPYANRAQNYLRTATLASAL
jgi:TolA-binding protein